MLSSALRMELWPLRVSVCTVRPGGIVSNISRNGIANTVFDVSRSLYAGLAHFVHERATASQSKCSTPTTAMAPAHRGDGLERQEPISYFAPEVIMERG
ncbi:hypothetical protein HK405_001662, partial [Cladochytrium tenue]